MQLKSELTPLRGWFSTTLNSSGFVISNPLNTDNNHLKDWAIPGSIDTIRTANRDEAIHNPWHLTPQVQGAFHPESVASVTPSNIPALTLSVYFHPLLDRLRRCDNGDQREFSCRAKQIPILALRNCVT